MLCVKNLFNLIINTEITNAVVLPHIGSASQVTRNRMVQLCIDNIKAVLNNDAPITPVTSLHF